MSFAAISKIVLPYKRPIYNVIFYYTAAERLSQVEANYSFAEDDRVFLHALAQLGLIFKMKDTANRPPPPPTITTTHPFHPRPRQNGAAAKPGRKMTLSVCLFYTLPNVK